MKNCFPQVLEVHEELEKSVTEEDLDAPEKAIVREMCNVSLVYSFVFVKVFSVSRRLQMM